MQTTPRKDGDVAKVEGDGGGAGGEEPLPHLTDINANPRLAQSTPQGRGAGRVDRELDSVSPVAFPEAGELASSMATSSSGESVELSQLYQDICDQKDIIMNCLEEDNCDIDQVSAKAGAAVAGFGAVVGAAGASAGAGPPNVREFAFY